MFYLSTQLLRRQYCYLLIGNPFVVRIIGLVKEMVKILYMDFVFKKYSVILMKGLFVLLSFSY